MTSALVLLACLSSRGSADLLADVAADESRLSDFYNRQDFVGVQSMYADSAVLIPPTADGFIPKPALAGFFEAAHNELGIRNLVLTPSVVRGTADNAVIHEIGTLSSSDTSANGPYYTRWVREDNAWKIETDIMALRQPPSAALLAAADKIPVASFHHVPDGADRAMVARKDVHFSELYNSEDFQAVQGLYAETAVLAPPDASSFIPQAALADFFAGAYTEGIRDLTLIPTVTQATADGSVVHELGIVSSTSVSGPYYVRWAKQADGGWKIETDIMSIGQQMPAPSSGSATLLAAGRVGPALHGPAPGLAMLSVVLVSLGIGFASMGAARQRATTMSAHPQQWREEAGPAAESYSLLEF